MEGIYKINLIPNDLSMEGTIYQIADTLDNLNGIVDDVFTRIMNRININTEKTSKLQERITLSRAKVEKLAGMQKAIKVFSSAKYPASIEHENYQSIFDTNCYHYESNRKITLSGKSQRQSNDKSIQERLHFFHVKVAESKTAKPKQDFNLKAVVNDVSTVGELLVYNTDVSPYCAAPNKTAAYVPRVSAHVEKNVLEEAPPSIMNRNILKREIDEYMYAPGMGMVPELDMPLDLPHLPGIAGDVQFLITSDGSIAPSAITSPVTPSNMVPELELPELPDLQDINNAVPDITDAPPILTSPAPVPPTMPGPSDMPKPLGMPEPISMPGPFSVPGPPNMPVPPPPPPPPPPPMDIQPSKERRHLRVDVPLSPDVVEPMGELRTYSELSRCLLSPGDAVAILKVLISYDRKNYEKNILLHQEM
ncbi:jg20487 [Pararge aegeria aegeria]|uniref:Jg20487 protein n=1 Tax=Pararge aegeria aegeria TaxID=348720 RepID=A0A8S4RTY1_9NEOP|nr:jg20487 [Pararge aegeria aegeria]